MKKKTKELVRNIVGAENFSDATIDRVAYSKDSWDYKHRPDAAAWPLSAEQVSEILKLANSEYFPVVARGAGTGLGGQAVSLQGGLILDMCRMDKIIEINIEDRLVVVQPGVVYAELERSLKPYGFFFPPDPENFDLEKVLEGLEAQWRASLAPVNPSKSQWGSFWQRNGAYLILIVVLALPTLFVLVSNWRRRAARAVIR